MENREVDKREEQNAIQSLLEDLNLSIVTGESDMKALLAALALPEKEFAFIQEIILSEFEKELNDTQDRILMIQALNSAGLKVEDLNAVFDELVEKIDNSFAGKISQQKIDFLKRFIGLMVVSLNETEGIAKRVVPIPIEYIHENAKKPTYANDGDAGLDVYALEDITIEPGQTVVVPTGLKIAIPLGYELQVRPRSGLTLKTSLRIANSPGTIDANYRGEIGVVVWNSEPEIKGFEVDYDEGGRVMVKNVVYGSSYTITKGMRFAQLVLQEIPTAAFYEVESVGEIGEDRRSGFGGTGTH